MLIDMQIIIDENNENVRLDRFLKKIVRIIVCQKYLVQLEKVM